MKELARSEPCNCHQLHTAQFIFPLMCLHELAYHVNDPN